jgi:hypothetical protein
MFFTGAGVRSIISVVIVLLVAAAALYLSYEIFFGSWLAASPGSDGKYLVPSLSRLVAVSALWFLSFAGTLAIVRFSADKNHEESSTFIHSTFSCGMSFAWIAMLGGIPVALYTGCTVDAGRGGAIATVLAVLGGPLAVRFAQSRKSEIEKLRSNHPFKMEDDSLKIDRTGYDELAGNLQKFHVLLAAVLGTLIWAYGDVAARFLQISFQTIPVCNF